MKKLLVSLVFFAFIAKNANSQIQISISNAEEIGKLKTGTTYVVMKDPNSPKTKDYIEAFKNNWTISKIEFIKYSEVGKYLKPENFFFTLGGYVTSVAPMQLYSSGGKHRVDATTTHIYLELWRCSEDFYKKKMKKKDKELGESDKISLAKIELFTDFPTLSDPNKLYQSQYDGDGHIRNWGPGILKNYIQLVTTYLNKGTEVNMAKSITNEIELKKLKSQTLFVPDYVLIKFNKFTGDESKKHEEKELFDDFKLKYKLLSTEELNQKILNDKEGFFYLVYIKSSTDKYISVINSLTGEMIYTKYSSVSYNIKSDDISDIQKKVK